MSNTETRPEFRSPGSINVALIRRVRKDDAVDRITLGIGEGVLFYSDNRPTKLIGAQEYTDIQVGQIIATARANSIKVIAGIPSKERVLYFIDVARWQADRKSRDGLISLHLNVGASKLYAAVPASSLGKIQRLISESPHHLDYFGDFFDTPKPTLN